jgi:hypothetical protein
MQLRRLEIPYQQLRENCQASLTCTAPRKAACGGTKWHQTTQAEARAFQRKAKWMLAWARMLLGSRPQHQRRDAAK